MNYLAVFIGGFFGAITRGVIYNLTASEGLVIPIKTVLINLTGSFLLVFIFTMASIGLKINQRVILGVTTGFLGAFTTFSTFTREVIYLAEQNRYIWAAIYILISNLGGLFLGWLGFKMALALRINPREPEICPEEKE